TNIEVLTYENIDFMIPYHLVDECAPCLGGYQADRIAIGQRCGRRLPFAYAGAYLFVGHVSSSGFWMDSNRVGKSIGGQRLDHCITTAVDHRNRFALPVGGIDAVVF